MSDITYQFRRRIGGGERIYRLTDRALLWSEGAADGRLPYSAIRKIRLFVSPALVNPMLGGIVVASFLGCVISGQGPAYFLSSSHYVRFAKFEDRSSAFRPFVTALVQRVAAANPATVFVRGMSIAMWTVWAAVLILILLALGLTAAVLVEVLPKATSEWVTVAAGSIMLLGLITGLPSLLRVLGHGWPRRFNPRLSVPGSTE